jgi:hypothetical protein
MKKAKKDRIPLAPPLTPDVRAALWLSHVTPEDITRANEDARKLLLGHCRRVADLIAGISAGFTVVETKADPASTAAQ